MFHTTRQFHFFANNLKATVTKMDNHYDPSMGVAALLTCIPFFGAMGWDKLYVSHCTGDEHVKTWFWIQFVCTILILPYIFFTFWYNAFTNACLCIAIFAGVSAISWIYPKGQNAVWNWAKPETFDKVVAGILIGIVVIGILVAIINATSSSDETYETYETYERDERDDCKESNQSIKPI